MLQNSFPELQQGPEGSPKCSQFGQKLAKRLEIEACRQKKSQKLIIFQEVPHCLKIVVQNWCICTHIHIHTQLIQLQQCHLLRGPGASSTDQHCHGASSTDFPPAGTRPPRPNHWAPWASWTLWVSRGSGPWSGGPRALVALGSGPTVPSSGQESNSPEPWVLVQ